MTSRTLSHTFVFVLLILNQSPCWAQWHYGAFNDPISGEVVQVASVDSKGWKGTLMVRLVGGGVLTAFGTPGTILCAEPCQVMVRLDGTNASMRDARPAGSRSDMLYFSPRTLPFETVAKSSSIEVEVHIKEHGWRVLTFDTSGFNTDRLSSATVKQKPKK